MHRETAIQQFNAPDSKAFIFLLSIRAAGRGLNLQSADTVVRCFLHAAKCIFECLEARTAGLECKLSARFMSIDCQQTRTSCVSGAQIIYDPDPNPKNEEQAIARSHRIGQTREVRRYGIHLSLHRAFRIFSHKNTMKPSVWVCVPPIAYCLCSAMPD